MGLGAGLLQEQRAGTGKGKSSIRFLLSAVACCSSKTLVENPSRLGRLNFDRRPGTRARSFCEFLRDRQQFSGEGIERRGDLACLRLISPIQVQFKAPVNAPEENLRFEPRAGPVILRT